jgi:hypothetical protein
MTWIWYGLIATGGILLTALYLVHQRLLPLERALLDPVWFTEGGPECGPNPNVRVDGNRLTVSHGDGTEFTFSLGAIKATPETCALVPLGDRDRRLLAILDRGRSGRTYVVDTARAAAAGRIDAAVVGWWRHGNGVCLTEAGSHLIEVHPCVGRDRIYWIDPLRAMSGQSFGLGIERTLVAPCRGVERVAYRDRSICLRRGDDNWFTELA